MANRHLSHVRDCYSASSFSLDSLKLCLVHTLNLVLPIISFVPITNEFSPSKPPLLTLAQNIGLLFGAMFWGFGCDVFGRRVRTNTFFVLFLPCLNHADNLFVALSGPSI